MLLREEFERREQEILESYAAKSSESQGREYQEKECPYRSCFQRDRDRIIHSEAFRRLEYKTQVFVNHEGDYYRTRLTHTLEVAQIARGLARTLRLNEDLAEAVALAHDLGHTPFGHRGEATLNELMAEHGGFEHNRQSFRVVTFLEQRYPQFPGLNLSYEVREGIVKHTTAYDTPDVPGFKAEGYPTLEAQIVNVADQIAYLNHDLDDGLKSGMLELRQLESALLWQETYFQVCREFPKARPKFHRYQTVRRLIHKMVTDVQDETKRKILKLNLKDLTDVRERGQDVVGFSPSLQKEVEVLREHLFKNLYQHYRVERMAEKYTRILRKLFKRYLESPKLLPPTLYELIQKNKTVHTYACDYIAGMTDRFALDEYSKLFDPYKKV